MGIYIRKRSSVEPAFIGKICNFDKEVIERGFSNKGMSDKKSL